MTSEIRSNKIKNRAGLGTVTFSGTGAILSGIVTASDDFRANEIRNQSGLGTITVSNSGAVVAGILSATRFVGDGTGLTGNLSYSGNYIGMSDTPSSFTAGAFHRSNDAANAMQNSATLFEDDQGRIGIGENSPGSKLHVKQNSDATYITIESGGNNIPYWVGVTGGASNSFYIENGNTFNKIIDSNSSDYVFLYGGGQQRIETTNTGVSISGVLDSTGDLQISDKIIHAGDTNTAIRFPLSDTIAFETGGTERYRINSSGNSIFAGNISAVDGTFSGDVSISGLLTYEDVTNIDSVGLITARSGIDVYFNGNKRIETTNLGNNIVGLTTITPEVKFTDNPGSSHLYHLCFVDETTGSEKTAADAAGVGIAKTLYHKWGGITYDDYDNTLNVSYMNAFKFRNIDTPAVLNNNNRMHLTLSNDASLPSTNNGSVALFECSSSAYITIGSGTGTNSLAGVLFANSSGNARGAISYKESTETISFHTLSLSSSNERLTISESGAVLSGIITATNFVKADGSSLGGFSPDAQGNLVAGTNAGSSFSGVTAEHNLILGNDAGNDITSGDKNILLGRSSGDALNSQYENVYIGDEAGYSSGGNRNIGIGHRAGDNDNGDYSISLGYSAGNRVSGSSNICIGLYSGGGSWAYNSGTKNIFIGDYIQTFPGSSQSNNVVIGHDAYMGHTSSLATGSNNIILGFEANPSANNVSNEITLGNSNITKFRIPGINVVLKDNGGTPTQGHVLTVDGSGEASFAAASGGVDSDATYNTVGGTNAGNSFTPGGFAEGNTLFGYDAGTAITGGDKNVAVGFEALKSMQTGAKCVMIGYQAGKECTGNWNTFIGERAGTSCTSGNVNVIIGSEAGLNLTEAADSVLIGYEAGMNITTNNSNTIIGYYAGANVTGSYNTIIGRACAGNITSGSGNIVIGGAANASSASVTNEITLGNANITKFRIPGLSASISTTESVLPAANFNAGVLQEAYFNDTGGGIQSNHTHDILTYGMVFYSVSNAAGSFTFNIRGDSSTTFDSLTTTGKVTTMTIYSANNNTGRYMTAFKIDGTTQTVKWAGGSAPSAATGSGVDVYSMTIMKTGSNAYHVFGNLTNFA